jgi:hypothetical protein
MSEYGPLITAFDVEEAVRSTLQAWLDTDLGEIERRSGGRWNRRDIQRPRSWQIVTDYRAHTADRRLPCVAVEIGEMEQQPAEEGRIDGAFGLNVIVIAKGSDRDRTRELVSLYEAAIRWCLLKRGTLDSFAAGVILGNTSWDAVPAEQSKTVAGATLRIVVEVAGIANRWGGPEQPDAPPPTPLPPTSPSDPAHTSTTVTVDQE